MNKIQEIKNKIEPLAKELGDLANKREQIENEIYALVDSEIKQGYQESDTKKVATYINLLPRDSILYLLSMSKYNRFCINLLRKPVEN